jgi:CxxC-x17-CxxC domain-containing protein
MQMYKAICADCGEECEVPFKPDEMTPAYCRECYSKRKSELPKELFKTLRKPNRAISPVAIVATVDPDGTPNTAPFGSLRAITPKLLRFASWRHHDTYKNLCRDERVTVTFLAPPNIAVSIRGSANVVREEMKTDKNYAIVEIEVEQVKYDMVRIVIIENTITISARGEDAARWFQSVVGELEEMSAHRVLEGRSGVNL